MQDQPKPTPPALNGAPRSDLPTPEPPVELTPDMPNYKGAPLDAERGPGLGCFWLQVAVLATFLVLTPLTVVWAWPSWISAAMLIIVLVLLLFVGQTTIFLLRLVAADRRTARRRPLAATARKTVGDIEEEAATSREDDASAG